MADKKQPPKGVEGPKQEPYDDDKRPRHRPEGREHEVHKEILERRWRGGPQPTPEDYQRALDQWQKIPGSVVRPPTDIKPPGPDESAPPQSEDTSQGGDKGNKP